MIALLVGTVLAVAALLYVLLPLFADGADERLVAAPPPLGTDAGATGEQGAIEALREIEFDRATGKLSDADYGALKARYTRQAVVEMRAAESVTRAASAVPDASPASADDPLEAVIARHRAPAVACAACGPRPEPNAWYCSSCGRYLQGRCPACGHEVREPGARFCGGCGHSLAEGVARSSAA